MSDDALFFGGFLLGTFCTGMWALAWVAWQDLKRYEKERDEWWSTRGGWHDAEQ